MFSNCDFGHLKDEGFHVLIVKRATIVLARGGIPAGRIIVHAAVTHVHAVDDGITCWLAALDNSAAHGLYLVIYRSALGIQLSRSLRPPREISGEAIVGGKPKMSRFDGFKGHYCIMS